jgi:hypothetical protein
MEQEIEKMVTELKEVIEKATKKKEVIVRGSKGAGKKMDGGTENMSNQRGKW